MNNGPYTRLTCYFLSGTGNSYRAAQWTVKAASDRGISTSLIPIDDARPSTDQVGGSQQLVGIFHPAHGMMPPWSMIKFLLRLPRGRGAHAMVTVTRGGIPIGPVVIPGASGLALFFPFLVLFLKGYRVCGGLGIDMPANMINLHWGMRSKNVARVLDWGHKRHQRLANAVFSGNRYFHPVNMLWELIWCIPFIIWPIFPIAYLMVGRIFMAKLMFAGTACRGCGKCARNCPNQAIKMIGSKPKTPFWNYHCEVCLRCMGFCNFKAVQASHLWLVLVGYATTWITVTNLQKLASKYVAQTIALAQPLDEIASFFLVFVSLILIYYLFFGLQRIKPLRVLFTYTTLTRLYRRRYFAPDTTPRLLRKRVDLELP